MLVDWTEPTALPVALSPKFDLDGDGRGKLMFTRLNDDIFTYLVADVDGPVHFAIAQVLAAGDHAGTPDKGCYLNEDAINEGKIVYRAVGHDWRARAQDSQHEGLIVASIGELSPNALQHFEDDRNYVYRASGSLILRGSSPSFEYYAMPWALTPETLVTSPAIDPDGLHATQNFVQGDAVFFQTGTLEVDRINVWTIDTGALPFVGTPGDRTQGGADLGTDGVDMVWTWGEGKLADDTVYPTRSIMTAAYTTDPNTLQSRRLRSQPDTSMGLDQHAVGCGYSAHHAGADDSIVVRLSDGWSWQIPSMSLDHTPKRPIGVTCEHVYIFGRFGEQINIARYRLDSLGVGMAPD